MPSSRKPTVRLGASFHVVLWIALLASPLPGRTEVKLGSLFGNNAVLQNGKPVPVWGSATPGEKVTVEFAGQTKEAVADVGGRWVVHLDPLPSSPEPRSLVARGENQITLSNVLVGEVWLCSGQSNMVFPVAKADNAATEIKAANFPLIRYFEVEQKAAEAPLDSTVGEWRECSPQTVRQFAATAYYFAREIHRELGIPVGIITSSFGGTQIEAWMSDDALKSTPFSEIISARWKKQLEEYPQRLAEYETLLAQPTPSNRQANVEGGGRKKAPVRPNGPGSKDTPSGLYNAMIHPLLPYAVRGIIWYQGESNATRPDEYRVLFPTLITQWRDELKQGDLPFYFVQLANYEKRDDKTGMTWALQREAQTAGLALSNTAMATAIDIGDPKNIHPTNKQEVGRRLALLALARSYGKDREYSGPILENASRNESSVRLRFSHADGLKIANAPSSGFELSSDGEHFRPAEARVSGNEVLVSAPDIPKPVAVRYAWHNTPATTLYNAAGLPAPPFQKNLLR